MRSEGKLSDAPAHLAAAPMSEAPLTSEMPQPSDLPPQPSEIPTQGEEERAGAQEGGSE